MAPRAFTVVELLVALAVAALLMSFALPSLQGLLAAERATAAINQIAGGLALARSQAILLRRTVTFCPGRGETCLGRNRWHEGALVFVDGNGDGRRQSGEALLRALPPLPRGSRVVWRSFRNRGYLQFHPQGYTQWQNGSFLYCPPDDNPAAARMAIVNAQGRMRMARDRDGDGVREDARGQALRCPP